MYFMVKSIIAYIGNRKTFFRGSAVLAFGTIASYALGLLRDRQFAQSLEYPTLIIELNREMVALRLWTNRPEEQAYDVRLSRLLWTD